MVALRTPAPERRLLPEGRYAAPMPWVIAIMMLLTVLAAAGGIALGNAAQGLGSELAQRITVQIVEANPDVRQRQAAAAAALLEGMPGVAGVRRIPEAEMTALLTPWLGEAADDRELPLPAMIDVTLAAPDAGSAARIASAVVRVAPAARIDDHARSLAPLAGLIGALRLLAAGLVVLMVSATAAAVVLAARAALNTHRGTIDVMHHLGATDVQIARIFQRRIALDALFGGLLGFAGAVLILLALGRQAAALGSELVGAVSLPPAGWALLLLLPLLGTGVALLVARWTALFALRKMV